MKKTYQPKRHFLLVLFITIGQLNAQPIPLSNAYAHNDYWHKRPLFDALENGFTYLEADIYLKKGNLIVAHLLPNKKSKRTFEALYLKPLLRRINANPEVNTRLFNVTLMIDIKSGADKTYATLLPLLEKYKSILSTFENDVFTKRNVTIIITGHKPTDCIKLNKYKIAFIDEDLMQTGSDSSLNTYITASCKYSNLLSWKGEGPIPEKERQRLLLYVLHAHAFGRKVRLWASPENSIVWQELLDCNVDLINTDRLKELRAFLISSMATIVPGKIITEKAEPVISDKTSPLHNPSEK